MNNSIKETGLWALVAAVTGSAFYLTYGFSFSGPIIAIIWIFWLLISLGLSYFTTPGQAVFSFGKESKIELMKVVWPTRQETVQTTMIVIVMVGLTGMVLWLFDLSIIWSIAKLTHLG